MKYFYDGQEVRVVSRFSDMWNIRVNRNGASEVISVSSELIDKIPTDSKAEPSKQTNTTTTPINDYKPSSELIAQQQALEESLKIDSESSSDGFLSINSASIDDLRKLNGVGKRTASKLLENRPDSGYNDINHMEELNADVRIDFNTLNEYIKFD